MGAFKGKVVWITGASSGIGLALVRELDQMGAKLVLSSRNVEKLEEVKNTLKGEEHFVLPLDLEDSSSFELLAMKVHERFGAIDYLINNGGMSQRAEAHLTPIEVDRRLMEINYFGNIFFG